MAATETSVRFFVHYIGDNVRSRIKAILDTHEQDVEVIKARVADAVSKKFKIGKKIEQWKYHDQEVQRLEELLEEHRTARKILGNELVDILDTKPGNRYWSNDAWVALFEQRVSEALKEEMSKTDWGKIIVDLEEVISSGRIEYKIRSLSTDARIQAYASQIESARTVEDLLGSL